MKISYITIVTLLLLTIYSCKDGKKSTSEEYGDEVKQDSLQGIQEEPAKIQEISLDPVKSEVPSFSDKEAATFVDKTRKYFEDVAEATKKGETDKVIELQLQSADIDTEFNKVKNKLNSEQQKQLTDWYMKLVEAASK